jgi:hypothetical protein
MNRCGRHVTWFVLSACLVACTTPRPQESPLSVARDTSAETVTTPSREPRGPFSSQEFEAFQAGVDKAENIADLTERCIAYPDPPGSHWSRDAVIAYCHYRLQPTLDYSFVVDAMNRRRAVEIDSAFDELVKQNSGTVRPQETIWRSMSDNFQGSSTQLRLMADDWKQQSPHSALAYTASAFVYKSMASNARGSDWESKTPQANIDAMHALLVSAKADLAKSVEIDPSLITPYALMVNVGMLDGDPAYADQGARRGLAVDPASFAIYDVLAMAAMPRWGGSRERQQELIKSAETQAANNPLLLTIRANVLMDVYGLRTCSCQTAEERAAYREVFDQVATARDLLRAGENAKKNHQPELAYVYLSEALRFYPMDEVRQHRQAVMAELAH